MKLGSFQIYLSREKWNRYFNNRAASKKRESSFSNYYYASIGRVGEASGELLWYGIVESFCARLVEQFPLSLSLSLCLSPPLFQNRRSFEISDLPLRPYKRLWFVQIILWIKLVTKLLWQRSVSCISVWNQYTKLHRSLFLSRSNNCLSTRVISPTQCIEFNCPLISPATQILKLWNNEEEAERERERADGGIIFM